MPFLSGEGLNIDTHSAVCHMWLRQDNGEGGLTMSVPANRIAVVEIPVPPVRIVPSFQKLVVVLIKPTHDDDAGFPHRYWRGVLPSNSLAVMRALTEQAVGEILPNGFPVEIHMLEDGIARHAAQLRRLMKRFPEPGTKLVVGLVAVQTAQFPRAQVLITRWQQRGATCVIGGFHVSGSISTMLDGIHDATRRDVPCPHIMPPEVQALMDRGVVVFHGEAEDVWSTTLADILTDRQQQLCRGEKPGIWQAPMPKFPAKYFSRSFVTQMRTLDANRGCPFACSFCCIIQVQGRTSRFRSPDAIVRYVEELCAQQGRADFFFTDDNFARNPHWEQVLDGLITLRKRGCKISFMIEADLASYKIAGFLEKLATAGCEQIFMGVESMNPANLAGVRKFQNKPAQYAELWKGCHELGLAIHAGYIIGFPHDTPASIHADVQALFDAGADQASFFILTPIPGSEDHIRAYCAGTPMEADLSLYDSFHACMDHPLMSREEWYASYLAAWHQFYSVGNMVAALRRLRGTARTNMLMNYVWYRWAFAVEGTHPMIAGIYRYRDWHDRRPNAAPLSFPRYLVEEVARHFAYIGHLTAEFFRFQHVVFEIEYGQAMRDRRDEFSGRLHGISDWFRLTFARRPSRQWLNNFWQAYGRKRWKLLVSPHWHLLMVPHAVSEAVYSVRFITLLPRLIKMTSI